MFPAPNVRFWFEYSLYVLKLFEVYLSKLVISISPTKGNMVLPNQVNTDPTPTPPPKKKKKNKHFLKLLVH